MGYWASKKKITASLRKTLLHPNFQTTLLSPKNASKSPQHFQFYFFNTTTKHKHANPFLPIKPFPFLPFSMLSSAPFTTACQLFDVLSQRDQTPVPATINFYDALDLIKISTLRPGISIAMSVHSVALKVGALAHLPASTSLLIAYSRAPQCYRYSVALFGEIVCKDVIVWNAMMTASVVNGFFGDTMNFFVEMLEEGSGFDSVTLVIAISALNHSSRLVNGCVVHGLSMKAGMLSDTCLSNALVDMYMKCSDLSSAERKFAEMKLRDNISWNSVISGWVNSNHAEKSLWYFKQMVCSGIQADHVSLSCAIAASTSLVDFGIGKIFHGWSVKLGHKESSFNSVANSLISLYSQCGDIVDAYAVFRGILSKDVISWNAMIDGYVSSGRLVEAFDLVYEMQVKETVQPDTVTVITVLPVCAGLMLLRDGKAIHGFTTRRVLVSCVSVMNSLLDMYLKCNSVKAAENLFHLIQEKDLISWNTMISGYNHNGYSIEAQILFKELLCWSPRCSLSTVLAILPTSDSPELLNFGKSLHGWQLKLGFINNIIAVNSLMFMYLNCGDLLAAFALLGSNWDIADTACLNTIIAGCVQNNFFLKALETFDLMRWQSYATHDSITLVSVLSACGNLGLVILRKVAHGLAEKTSLANDMQVQNALITMYGRIGELGCAIDVFNLCHDHNLCSWNCMISAFSQNKVPKRALELFHCLDLEPDEITVSTILSACTQLGTIRHGKQIHAYVFRSGFYKNTFITAALVDMYSNCGKLDIALCVFQDSSEKSVATWNSMISAYGFHSCGQKGIEVFDEMIHSGADPTKTTFINLLSACSHSGLVKEGLWYYDQMYDKYGVEPVTEHHVCVVDMLGRSGRLSDACEFIRRIPSEPEAGVWGALLSACMYHGDLVMGRKVADGLFGLEPENVGYYVSLYNMYVAAGRWSDAVKVMTMVHDKHLKKPAGCSLIDVGLG